ncbi:MAG: hypothetical protein KTR15_14255 [Phycisphaeraceae bacterium]|nr:hypothetical protein [Phycisphaeraceae bacterium]
MLLIVLLALPGCGDLSNVLGNPQDRAKKGLADSKVGAFEIGPASNWAEPKLYMDYAKSHGIALKSEHGMLVALLLIGPKTGAEVRYDRLAGLFRDSQSGETFTTDGVKWGGDDDRPSLARCRIRHLGPLDDPDVGLIVDPGKLFRQEDQQWSKAASNHLFVEAKD